ncbi:MAG: nitroreductase family protein [Acidobacteriia bacterium]|nr:nitroreductase family protein [Terriglobia bacterium]
MHTHARKRLAFAFLALCPALWAAEEPKAVALPAPQLDIGKPLMQALKERRSTREFAPDKLPLQVLSNLLWAANGENRPGGQRTAPSAVNAQQVDIYVALADGTYLYQAKGHRLLPIAAEDHRKLTGTQPFVAAAPLNLVYIADLTKPGSAGAEDRLIWAAAGTGFISQNVYLYCASEGLVTVVRAFVDRGPLEKALKLRPDQRIILSQTVGYPRK